jgi:putative ABC transport system permease protein
MNSMWVSVRERTPEVGTLRAIGMGRRQVLFMFLLEALALGLLSTTLGSVLGAAVAGGLDALDWSIPSEAVQAILMSETLNLVVKPQQLVLAVAAFTGLSGLAAVLPAYRASRLQPVTAIHFLG